MSAFKKKHNHILFSFLFFETLKTGLTQVHSTLLKQGFFFQTHTNRVDIKVEEFTFTSLRNNINVLHFHREMTSCSRVDCKQGELLNSCPNVALERGHL